MAISKKSNGKSTTTDSIKPVKDQAIGENVEYSIDDKGILTMVIDLTKKGNESKSGKTDIIASTKGNKRMGNVFVGVNVYRYRDSKSKK